MEIENDLKVGSFNSQPTSLSLSLAMNVRGLYSLVYAWKEKCLTGGRLRRISSPLGLKYRLGSSYAMETITAQIGQTWKDKKLDTLALFKTTYIRLID